jgi:hypothetical protein
MIEYEECSDGGVGTEEWEAEQSTEERRAESW